MEAIKLTRKIAIVILSSVACASLVAAIGSFWYLWHLASRVRDPSRGLVHAVTLGTYEEGRTEFTVYLSRTESVVVWPELYFIVCGVALALLLPRLWWKTAPQRLRAQ
jgi:hypothetical protein